MSDSNNEPFQEDTGTGDVHAEPDHADDEIDAEVADTGNADAESDEKEASLNPADGEAQPVDSEAFDHDDPGIDELVNDSQENVEAEETDNEDVEIDLDGDEGDGSMGTGVASSPYDNINDDEEAKQEGDIESHEQGISFDVEQVETVIDNATENDEHVLDNQEQLPDDPQESVAKQTPEPDSEQRLSPTGDSITAGSDAMVTPGEERQQDIESLDRVPSPPGLLTSDTLLSDTSDRSHSTSALSMVWSFGLNRNIPVLNLSDEQRKMIVYACAHTVVMYDFVNNKQRLLQGHSNAISCSCVSEDKRWLATGDKGSNGMLIIWDTHTCIPVQTLFEPHPNGVASVCMTNDARYLATLSADEVQVLAIWDWTVDGDSPVCTAQLKPQYGLQNYMYFNPDDVHYMVSNSDSQVIFYYWEHGNIEYYAPPLTDQDFNKAVGRYSQSVFMHNDSRALTATSIGNLVVWDSNKPSGKGLSDKKAMKIIRLQDRGIQVLTITERYIVVGDVAGHVKFFDQTLKLINWYQDIHLGPINAISFQHVPEFLSILQEDRPYPPDATIAGKKFFIRNFVVGTNIAIYGHVATKGTNVEVILREHDAPIHALAVHPNQPFLAVGSYAGLLKIWDYEKKQSLVSRQFERGGLISCCVYDPKAAYIALGFVNGSLYVIDAITLDDELSEPFRYSRDAITHITFSHNSQYLATADAGYAITVYERQTEADGPGPYDYLGRYRAHYKLVRDIMFGVQLDTNIPRLLSLGEDRVLVEYDLQKSCRDNLCLLSTDRIEQSAVPQCMTFYPPISKENFILTANDQYKFKLYNTTTKMCRKTLLGPTYGSPLRKIVIIPSKDPSDDRRYMAYITKDKVGMNILPLDGNPHNAMALIAHPVGVSNLACSYEGKYLFTTGGPDATLHMWHINVNALEAQSQLGGEDLIPFYGLLDGGRDGPLFSELEDYFYYAQIRNQGINALNKRSVSVKIPLTEVPFVMRALGFYPSEQEIEDMLNEVKFSRYVETGEFLDQIDLGDFIKLYINHRPAFGLSVEKLLWAFEHLGIQSDDGAQIERGELLDLLQTKGEHMTEYELAEYLTTLLGYNDEGGSSELAQFDASTAVDIIDQSLPHNIDANMFSREILGFPLFPDKEQSVIAAGNED